MKTSMAYPMFLGEYKHSLDDKGRLAIPTKFRSALKTGAVVTRGLDGSLVLYGVKEWRILAEKLAALPISKQTSRAFARLMLAGAMDVLLDKQGRVTIPEYLRVYAKMHKNVVVAGLYNRLELWDEDGWKRYQRKNESEGADIA
ncbi:MAG: division/cell wall cluster transcriptional repressor MraZ, partial [Patescibacteria group bacterium]